MNQCDGCKRQLPLEDEIHIDPSIKGWGRQIMVCTKERYKQAERSPKEGVHTLDKSCPH